MKVRTMKKPRVSSWLIKKYKKDTSDTETINMNAPDEHAESFQEQIEDYLLLPNK